MFFLKKDLNTTCNSREVQNRNLSLNSNSFLTDGSSCSSALLDRTAPLVDQPVGRLDCYQIYGSVAHLRFDPRINYVNEISNGFQFENAPMILHFGVSRRRGYQALIGFEIASVVGSASILYYVQNQLCHFNCSLNNVSMNIRRIKVGESSKQLI